MKKGHKTKAYSCAYRGRNGGRTGAKQALNSLKTLESECSSKVFLISNYFLSFFGHWLRKETHFLLTSSLQLCSSCRDARPDTHSDDVQRVVADFADLGVGVVHQVDEVRGSF